jgi:hypothetical protein
MMDLVLTNNNFEKRNRELAFAAARSSTQCFLKQAHIHTYSMHTYNMLPAAVSTATATVIIMVRMQEIHSISFGWPKAKPTVTVQHNFHHTHGRNPVSKVIRPARNQFKKHKSVQNSKSPGCLRISEDDAEHLRLLCHHSQNKSTVHLRLQLAIYIK